MSAPPLNYIQFPQRINKGFLSAPNGTPQLSSRNHVSSVFVWTSSFIQRGENWKMQGTLRMVDGQHVSSSLQDSCYWHLDANGTFSFFSCWIMGQQWRKVLITLWWAQCCDVLVTAKNMPNIFSAGTEWVVCYLDKCLSCSGNFMANTALVCYSMFCWSSIFKQ